MALWTLLTVLCAAAANGKLALGTNPKLYSGASPQLGVVKLQEEEGRMTLQSNVESSRLRGGGKGRFELPDSIKLFIGAAGIFASFSLFAITQEDVYKKGYGDGAEKFKYTFLALIAERGINSLVAAIGILILKGSGLKIPTLEIFNSGISQMLAMASSNEALRYVSYPTQVLGKSCKMVPVMAGGLVLGGKKYSMFEYLQVALITGGVCIFNLMGKKKKAGGGDSAYGLGLIGISLLLDAVTGGLQDKVKASAIKLNPGVAKAKPSMHESMFYTNLSGAIVAFLLALATGHLTQGISFCMRNPDIIGAIALFSLSSALGQNFIYYTITEFGPLKVTTVTTVRKIFSTLYSVFRNPANSLTNGQWGGCGLVFIGLLGDVLKKYMKAQ